MAASKAAELKRAEKHHATRVEEAKRTGKWFLADKAAEHVEKLRAELCAPPAEEMPSHD